MPLQPSSVFSFLFLSSYTGSLVGLLADRNKNKTKQNATLQSTQGSVDVSSQFSLEFLSGGSTFDAGNNLNIEADGDAEFFSRNDIGLLSADQLSFTFPKSESKKTRQDKTKQTGKQGK